MKTAREWAGCIRNLTRWKPEHGDDTYVATAEDYANIIQQALQAQHEATWAMAMEAAAEECVRDKANSPHNILSLPCPPLQTNNEKCE